MVFGVNKIRRATWNILNFSFLYPFEFALELKIHIRKGKLIRVNVTSKSYECLKFLECTKQDSPTTVFITPGQNTICWRAPILVIQAAQQMLL